MVIYEGPSMLNGKPIVAIATGFHPNLSSNIKTGPMIQTWILAQDEEPHQAVKSGKDEAVCGDCKLRPLNLGVCYVLTFQGPLNIYRTWERGGYPVLDYRAFAGLPVRFGAYGDPAAVPFRIWDEIGFQAITTTGYTHAWKYCDPLHKHYCMASVDSPQEALDAREAGWRTFRVTTSPGDKSLSDEIICPASAAGGHKLQCIQCCVCDGQSRRLKSHVVIHAHGARANNLTRA